MDAFELKDRLAEKLGEQESRELLSFITSQGGSEQAERITRMEDKMDKINDKIEKQENRLTRVETKIDGVIDRLGRQQTSSRRLIGIGLTAVGLLVGILVKVL